MPLCTETRTRCEARKAGVKAGVRAAGGTDIDIPAANDLKTRDMDKYVCIICGYIYDPAEGDPESGIAPGTAFEDIPEDWTCPACGVGKEHFEKWNG